MRYEERFYRVPCVSKFRYEVVYKESDIYVGASSAIEERIIKDILCRYYRQIEDYGKNNPEFFTSLFPIKPDAEAPLIAREMLKSSEISGIGPFSAVAGAIAWFLGRELLTYSKDVIVENGGDLFLSPGKDFCIGLYLGQGFNPSVLNVRLDKRETPFGVASSSAVMGHSLSFGRADLVTVIADDSISADTFATAFANKVKSSADVPGIISLAGSYPFIRGIVAAVEGKVTIWGDIVLEGARGR